MKSYAVRTIIVSLALVFSWNTVLAHADTNKAGLRYYSVLMMQVTDEAQYANYRKLFKPLFSKAGCMIERELLIADPPNGPLKIGTPNRVISLYCDTSTALNDMPKDPRYQELLPLREASTQEFSLISGKNVHYGQSSSSNEKERLYIIKLTRFKENAHFEPDLKQFDQELAPYGLHRENLIYADFSKGVSSTPTTVGFMFYDKKDQQEGLYADKDMMNRIGEFNKQYTEEFVYLQGVVK